MHITGATLALLAGAYAVEDVSMEHRDPYLRELGEPTYLVIDPRVKAQPGPHGLARTNHPQLTGLISSPMPNIEFLDSSVCINGVESQPSKGYGENVEYVCDLDSQLSYAPG